MEKQNINTMRKVHEYKFYVTESTYNTSIQRGDRIGKKKILTKGFTKYDDAMAAKVGIDAKNNFKKLNGLK